MPKVGVPRSSPAARKPTPAPAARRDPHPLSGWKARRLPHHKLYPPGSYVRDGDGHKDPSRGPRYPRVGSMLARNWPLPGNGSCSEIRASTVRASSSRESITNRVGADCRKGEYTCEARLFSDGTRSLNPKVEHLIVSASHNNFPLSH